MKHRRLGDSGLAVSSLALGTMVFGEDSPRSTPSEDAARIIARFLDAGGTHIDTANVYAGGRSEEIIGEVLGSHRAEVVLATKVRGAKGTGPNDAGLSRRHVIREVHSSLRRLQTDWVDVLYMHQWDPVTPIEESLAAFDDLVRAGAVHYVGLSNFAAWQVMKTAGLTEVSGFARPVAAQYQYSLVTRDIEFEYLPLFESEGLGLVPWGPLGGGFLSGKYRPGERPTEGRIATQPDRDEEAWGRRNNDRNWAIVDAVGTAAAELGVTASQVAIAWLLTRPTVASVILGVRTLDQLEDNLAAADLELPDEVVARLDDVSDPPAPYPYRMNRIYGDRVIE